MPATILDAFGNPAVTSGYGGRGNLYQRDNADARLRPPPPQLFDDYVALLSPARWKQLISESRSIASKGQVAAAIWQKADYVSASHWRPYFTGENADWGEPAEQLLEDTASACCTRGPRFDWRTLWRLTIPARAADGGLFIALTTYPGSDWPLLQPIEAHRVGSRTSPHTITKEEARSIIRDDSGKAKLDSDGMPEYGRGLYAGLRIVNGIIYNRVGAEVAYRVIGPDPSQDEDVSARDMIHVGAPRWYSEGRPLPEIAPALLELYGIDLARAAQLDQQIIDSKLTVIETNEAGRQDPVRNLINPPMSGPTTPAMTNPELVERGQFRYIKSGTGGIEAWKSSRPSDQWMNYDERLSATSIAAIGWRLEMLDPSALRGAATRGFQDQINTAICNSFEDARPHAVRAVRYLISKHIQAGRLPDDPEFLKWDITPPPEFVVDRGAMKTEIEAVRAGVQSMPDVQRRNGGRPRRVLISQARYEQMKNEIAEEYDVDPMKLGTLAIAGDNNQAQSSADGESNADANGKPSDDDDEKNETKK